MTKMSAGSTVVTELPFHFYWLGRHNFSRHCLQQ